MTKRKKSSFGEVSGQLIGPIRGLPTLELRAWELYMEGSAFIRKKVREASRRGELSSWFSDPAALEELIDGQCSFHFPLPKEERTVATATEKQFAAIIREAIQKAQKVNCPFEDYVKGLEEMRDELQEEYEVQFDIWEKKQKHEEEE